MDESALSVRHFSRKILLLDKEEELKNLCRYCENLPTLRRLTVECCALTMLPESFGNFSSLEELFLSNLPKLTTLCSSFGNLQSLKKLTIYACTLTTLPESFVYLKGLEKLTLRSLMKLTKLCSSFGNLPLLKELELKDPALKKLPDTFGNLRSLEKMVIDHLDVWYVIYQKALRHGFCTLTKLPDSFGSLKCLEHLDIWNLKFLTGLCSSFGSLPALKSLSIRKCSLMTLPDSFGSLQHLEHLELIDIHSLTELCSSFGNLPALKELEVSRCQLKKLPDSFGSLQRLEHLELIDIHSLTELCSSFGNLPALKELEVSICQLKKLPESFGSLQRLEHLELIDIRSLTELCSTFGNLPALKELEVSRCQLKKLPESFGSLQRLEHLELRSMDSLTELCSTFGNLPALKRLNVRHCQLKKLPHSFGSLQRLEELEMCDNNLGEYPACLLNLPKLHRVDLSNTSSFFKWYGNHIKELPLNLKDTCLKTLVLDGNQLVMPPKSIWEQGLEAIKLYLKDLTSGGKELLCADTINMIGESGAGKTSIAMSLVNDTPVAASVEDRTRVMQQFRANLSSSTDSWILINDFGGHYIYRSIIPLFLPFNGLSILAYNLMTSDWNDQENNVKNWILTVIAKSTQIRVIVAGTRSDLVSSDEERLRLKNKMQSFVWGVVNKLKKSVEDHIRRLKRRRDETTDKSGKSRLEVRLNELESLRRKVEKSEIVFATVSCEKCYDDLNGLRSCVCQSIQPAEIIPARWWPFIQDILKTKNESFLRLTMKEVKEMYKKHISDDPQCMNLSVILKYLTSSSQILWIEDDPRLRGSIFHSPQHIVAICTKVIDHRANENQPGKRRQTGHQTSQGRLVLDDCAGERPPQWADVSDNEMKKYKSGILQLSLLEKLLSEYTEQEIEDVIALMKKFNLISEIKPTRVEGTAEDRTFVITSNIPEEEPKELKNLTDELRKSTSSVCVILSFIGCIVPLSFFATSLSAIMTVAREVSKGRANTNQWRDGLIICHNDVDLLMRRLDQEVIFTAGSRSPERSPWLILYPILERLQENICASWPGVPPKWEIVCPACRRLHERDGWSGKLKRIEISFEEFANHSTEGSNGQFEKQCFPECLHSVPQLLCQRISQDYFTVQQQQEISAFYRTLDCLEDHAAGRSRALARQLLSKAREQLVHGLDATSIDSIIDKLISARGGLGLISDEERQLITAERTSQRKARLLLDTIDRRGAEAVRILADTLSSSYCGRPDLADLST